MFWFKSCPRCKGDLYREQTGEPWHCVQCSREMATEAVRAGLLARQAAAAAKAAADFSSRDLLPVPGHMPGARLNESAA